MEIRVKENLDGGDFVLIEVEDETGLFHDLQLDGGLETPIYLSHFGGNVKANTTGNEEPGILREDWYGNAFVSEDPDRRANSDLERALIELPISSGNLLKYEDAAEDDLAWLINNGIAASVASEAVITAPESVKVTDTVEQPENDTDTVAVWEFEKERARANT